MKKALLPLLLALLTLFPLAGAQQPALSIAFVQSARVLAAHPAGQAATRLTEQARTELQQIAATLQPLQAKAGAGTQLTPDEQNTLELTQRTLQETQQRYQQEIQSAAQPAEQQITTIINRIAQEKGYSLILNRDVAQTSGLIVYADNGSVPDITEEVIAAIEAANPGAAGGN